MFRKKYKNNGTQNDSRHIILMIGPSRSPYGGQASLVNTILLTMKNKFEYILLDVEHNSKNLLERMLVTIGFGLQLFRLLIKNKGIRLLHIHTSAGRALFEKSLFVALGKMFGKKVILHIHGGRFKKLWNQAGTVKRIIIRQLLNMNDLIVVLADNWKNYYETEVKCKCRIAVIHNSVAIEKVSIRKKTEDISFLYVGELRLEKGIVDLIEAFNIVSNLEIHRVCLKLVGENKNCEVVNKIIKSESNRITGIKILGPLYGRLKWEQFAESDIFVFPSHSEDMPIAILEAMAFGLPVIASSVGSIPEMVVNGINGYLIEPKKTEELVNRMCELIKHPELRFEMGNASRKLSETKYSLEILEENLSKVYLSLL